MVAMGENSLSWIGIILFPSEAHFRTVVLFGRSWAASNKSCKGRWSSRTPTKWPPLDFMFCVLVVSKLNIGRSSYLSYYINHFMIENPTLPTEFLHASGARKYREKPKPPLCFKVRKNHFKELGRKTKLPLEVPNKKLFFWTTNVCCLFCRVCHWVLGWFECR